MTQEGQLTELSSERINNELEKAILIPCKGAFKPSLRELKKGIEGGKAFIDALKLHYHVANIGDARSLAIHPASTTHSQLTAEEQLKAGVTPGYIRLCVGLEHVEDIIEDLKIGLEASSKVARSSSAKNCCLDQL